MRRPEPEDLELAADLLWRLAAEHGLFGLRVGSEPGELVVDVGGDRTYFDVVGFEDDVKLDLVGDQLSFPRAPQVPGQDRGWSVAPTQRE